jgi:predicted MFS family arabinose efflux permease
LEWAIGLTLLGGGLVGVAAILAGGFLVHRQTRHSALAVAVLAVALVVVTFSGRASSWWR